MALLFPYWKNIYRGVGMKDNHIVVLLGKSASGKDTVAKTLSDRYGYTPIVSTTSRPMRSNEVNHKDYHFVSNEVFLKLIKDEKLVEYRLYKTIQDGGCVEWYYGIGKKDVEKKDGKGVCVVDLTGLKHMKEEYGNSVISIYIDVPEGKRRCRAMSRDSGFELGEWSRRDSDDEVRFKNIDITADIVVKNDTLQDCVRDIKLGVKKILERKK